MITNSSIDPDVQCKHISTYIEVPLIEHHQQIQWGMNMPMDYIVHVRNVAYGHMYIAHWRSEGDIDHVPNVAHHIGIQCGSRQCIHPTFPLPYGIAVNVLFSRSDGATFEADVMALTNGARSFTIKVGHGSNVSLIPTQLT